MALNRWRIRIDRQGRGHHTIDLGGGRQVTLEDVLEGHFRRLSLAGAAPSGPTQEVSVQVTPSLHTAIRVVAPTVAPLASIAEELVSRIPSVQPSPDFRSELHNALQEAYRVQAERAQVEDGKQRSRGRRVVLWLAAAALVVVAVIGVLWRLRRRQTA